MFSYMECPMEQQTKTALVSTQHILQVHLVTAMGEFITQISRFLQQLFPTSIIKAVHLQVCFPIKGTTFLLLIAFFLLDGSQGKQV